MSGKTLAGIKKRAGEVIGWFDEHNAALKGVRRISNGQMFVLFCLMVGKSFVRNRCPVRASALAYTTLLAMVPLLAVGLGVSINMIQYQGTQPVRDVVEHVINNVAPQLGLITTGDSGVQSREEVINKITDFIAQIHSGALGVSGTIGLIATAILLLGNIETTINDIWGVSRGRNWFARVIQYWAAITLGPLLSVLAIGLTLGGQFRALQEKVGHVPMLGDLVFNLTPLLVLALVFTMFYKLMPNTKVEMKAAMVGGLVGGFLWHLNTKFNVAFAAKVVTASKIYGSLSAVPVMLIGLYFSWLIMLFGAQVSYAYQNRRTYLQEKQAELVNQSGREFVAMRIMVRIAAAFSSRQPPPTANQIADDLDVPTRLVMQVLHQLAGAGLVVGTASEKEPGHVPARPIGQITARDILAAMRSGTGQRMDTAASAGRDALMRKFDSISAAEAAAAESITLDALAAHQSAAETASS